MMFNNTWDEILNDELSKPYFINLTQKVDTLYCTKTIYPPKNKIFNALKLTDYHDVRVVILGQDPYFNYGQANGLAFSVNSDTTIPKSLNNIYKEINNDLGTCHYNDGDLTQWAIQGVLLLNTILTVEDKKPGSHRKIGWEEFTDCIIKKLNNRQQPIIFLLWGKYAMSKSKLIDQSQHMILQAPHPSPLSAYRGFFGCKHFSKTNQFLLNNNIKPIKW